eukprot:6513815-Lingulodinium_polyedra.AAC.1
MGCPLSNAGPVPTGSVEINMRARGNAVQSAASETNAWAAIPALSMPKTAPIAARSCCSVAPAFSQRTWTA